MLLSTFAQLASNACNLLFRAPRVVFCLAPVEGVKPAEYRHVHIYFRVGYHLDGLDRLDLPLLTLIVAQAYLAHVVLLVHTPSPVHLAVCTLACILVMVDAPKSSRRKSHKVAMEAAEPLLSLLPISILTDSYKTTHYLQYPESSKMVAVRVCVALLPCRLPENASHKIQLSSTQNSAMAMTRIQMIQGSSSMAYDTCWKLSLPDSGLSKMLRRQLLSSGMHVHMARLILLLCKFAYKTFFASLQRDLCSPATKIYHVALQHSHGPWIFKLSIPQRFDAEGCSAE